MEEVLVPTRCQSTKRPFILRFERIAEGKSEWKVIEAEQLEQGVSGSEADGEETRIEGNFSFSYKYDGCPYCGQNTVFHCGRCDSIACYDGQTERVVCPWCDSKIQLTEGIDDISGSSGDATRPQRDETSGLTRGNGN